MTALKKCTFEVGVDHSVIVNLGVAKKELSMT